MVAKVAYDGDEREGDDSEPLSRGEAWEWCGCAGRCAAWSQDSERPLALLNWNGMLVATYPSWTMGCGDVLSSTGCSDPGTGAADAERAVEGGQ